MKVKVDPTQLNWIKLVATRRLAAATKTNDVKGAELFKYLIGKVEGVAGDTLLLTRKGARVLEKMCLDHISFMSGTMIPELKKRKSADSEKYEKQLKTLIFTLSSVEDLYKKVKETL